MVKDESGNFYVSIILNNKIYAVIFPCGIREPVNKGEKKQTFLTSVFNTIFKFY